MNIDIERLQYMLKSAMLEKLGDEVDLIIYCGSQLAETTHRYSDIDILYVPVHEATWDSITVLIDDVMTDFYPIHWSRLEAIASFDDPSSGVLLAHEVLYAKNGAVRSRLAQLTADLNTNTAPDARRFMVRKSMDLFQAVMYQYYMLQQPAVQSRPIASMLHAQRIMQRVLHCLMVINQATIDTRKRDQVLGLEKLPALFETHIDTITKSSVPEELLNAAGELLDSTRDLILKEQNAAMTSDATFQQVLDAAYPELKNDLLHILLACEQKDTFNFSLMSLHHELMIHMSQVLNGVQYTGFNTVAEYEQDLRALGFPDLMPYVAARDFDALHAKTLEFDQCLQRYLTEIGVPLNSFSSLDEFSRSLE